MKKFFAKLFGTGSKSGSKERHQEGPDLVGFVRFVVESIVSDTSDVRVESSETSESLDIVVHCKKGDIGRVIGRKGKTIDSIRALVRGAGTRMKKRVTVEIAEPSGTNAA